MGVHGDWFACEGPAQARTPLSEYLHILRNPRSEYAIRWLVENLRHAKKCGNAGKFLADGWLVGEFRLLDLYSSVLLTYLIFRYWTARTPKKKSEEER